jgi:hypothetical protein
LFTLPSVGKTSRNYLAAYSSKAYALLFAQVFSNE